MGHDGVVSSDARLALRAVFRARRMAGRLSPHSIHMRQPMLLALALFAAAPSARAQDRSRETQLRELDTYIQRGMTAWNLPGLSIVVVANDSVLFTKGYGVQVQRSTMQQGQIPCRRMACGWHLV